MIFFDISGAYWRSGQQREKSVTQAPLPEDQSGKQTLPSPAVLSETVCASKCHISIPGGFSIAGDTLLYTGS